MFGIGFLEATFCLLLGFLVLGPEKLISTAREGARGFSTLRRMASSLSAELSKEVDDIGKNLSEGTELDFVVVN